MLSRNEEMGREGLIETIRQHLEEGLGKNNYIKNYEYFHKNFTHVKH